MKYENVDFETILERMLNRVPERYDKRETGVVYTALAPAAAELAIMYMELDIILQDTFADTASRDYLVRRVAERGIVPEEATKSVVKGVFTPASINVPIGTRFSVDELNFVVIDKISDGEYQLESEQIGTIGNDAIGTAIPIDYVDGLETANVTELLIPGEDEENTESIRARYFQTFDTKPFGGNKKDYIQKTNSIEGVGKTKVTPVWQGGGTVLLTILGADFNKATQTLINRVQNEVDPLQNQQGGGTAPIGHVVTVNTVNEVVVNFALNVTFEEGYSFSGQKDAITAVIEDYLFSLRENWADQSHVTVRTAQIDTKILALEGVIDIGNTRINGVNQNLVLTEYDIPILGGVTND